MFRGLFVPSVIHLYIGEQGLIADRVFNSKKKVCHAPQYYMLYKRAMNIRTSQLQAPILAAVIKNSAYYSIVCILEPGTNHFKSSLFMAGMLPLSYLNHSDIAVTSNTAVFRIFASCKTVKH